MWAKIALVFSIVASGTVGAWDRIDVERIFLRIDDEIQYIEAHQHGTVQGPRDIAAAMRVVFHDQRYFVPRALEVPSFKKKEASQHLISYWLGVAADVLWGVCHYRFNDSLLRMAAINDYHRIFATRGAFNSLVSHYSLMSFQNRQGLSDLQIANRKDLINKSDKIKQAASQAFERTALEIFKDYLFAEGISVFEAINHTSSIMEVKEAVMPSEEYSLNIFRRANTCTPLNLANVTDPSLREWLEFVNQALTKLKAYTFPNGKAFTQEFSYVDFALNFGAVEVLRNDQPLPLKDALMETVWFHIYDIYHYGQVGPVNSQVLLIELNLRPGALASTPSEIKKLKQQLANELSQGTVHKPTTPGRRLRLFGRLNKFGRDPSHVVDCVRDLVNVKPKALANNWGQNMLNP